MNAARSDVAGLGVPAAGRFETIARTARRHGVWLLAASAPFVALDVWSLAASPASAHHALPVGPADILLAVLAALAIAEVMVCRRAWRHALPPAAAWAWIAAACLSLSAAAEGNLRGAVKEIVQLAEVLIVCYAWVRGAPDDERAVRRAVLALGAAVTVHAAVACVQYLAGAHTFHVRGLFEHRNSFGAFVAVAAPVLVGAALSRGTGRAVRVWLLAAAAVAAAMITSGGLFVACAVGVMTAGFMRAPRAGALVWCGVLVLAAVVQPLALPRLRQAQLASLMTFPADEAGRAGSSARVRRWQACVRAFAARPLAGGGIGQFQSRVAEEYRAPFDKPTGSSGDVTGYDLRFDEPGSQCLYEVVAVETGTIGLMALLSYLAWALARAADASSRDRLGIAAGGAGTVAAVIVAGLSAAVFVRGVALVFVCVLALGARSAEVAPEAPAAPVP